MVLLQPFPLVPKAGAYGGQLSLTLFKPADPDRSGSFLAYRYVSVSLIHNITPACCRDEINKIR